jgi:hypothetical protein
MRDRGVRERTFEALYAAHYQAIAGYVLRRVAAHEADDVIAQVFTVAWRRFGLPGVRLIGAMTDPLGRPGYALAPGSQDPNADSSHFNPTKVVLIDPRSGSLLATADIGPMPRTVHCLSFDVNNNCTGSTYYGRSYPDQVDEYVVVVSEGWTNASPVLPPPSTWSGSISSPGLPPLP